jgi:predicted PurR-regulated permease PerM
MVYVGLWILAWVGIDLPNKFTLALIAGLFEFLPYIGPALA